MNLTVTSLLKRVLALKGFRYQSAQWVKGVGKERQGIIEVQLAARREPPPAAERCGRPAPGYDRSAQARCWQFISLWAIQVFFVYAPRRVECRRCGVRVERLPWASGKLRLCDALRVFLAQWARLLSWQTVAERFGVQWNDVYVPRHDPGGAGASAQEAALDAAQTPAQLDDQRAGSDAGVADLRTAQFARLPFGGKL